MSSSPSTLLSDGKWVHVDSTLDYPVSLNHPYYYEENWGKQYEYVLAFSADKIEDVTQRYTLQWETIEQRRLKIKKNTIDFPKVYSRIWTSNQSAAAADDDDDDGHNSFICEFCNVDLIEKFLNRFMRTRKRRRK